MKPSYFTTPRRLDECHFNTSADPIERPVTDYPVIWWLCLIAIGLVSAAAIWVTR